MSETAVDPEIIRPANRLLAVLARVFAVERVVRVLLLVLLAGVGAGGFLLWSRAERAFGVFGSATLFAAVAVMATHIIRAVLGRFLLPSFIVFVLAAIPAVVLARMADNDAFSRWLWVYSSQGTLVGGVILIALLTLGLVLRRRVAPALSLLLLVGSLVLIQLASTNFDRIIEIQSDMEALVAERQAAQRAVAIAEKAKEKRLDETGGAITFTMSEEEAADEHGMTTAEREAWRDKMRKAAEARQELKALEEQRKAEQTDYGDLGNEFATAGDDGAEDEVYQDLEAQLQRQLVAQADQTWSPDEKARAADYADYLSVFAKYLLVVSVLMAAVGYFHQLSRTDCACHALPLAGRWLEEIVPTEHVVWFDVDDQQPVAAYLKMAVAKGESFVHCGPDRPILAAALPRWRFLGFGLPTLGLDALKDRLWQEHLRDDEDEFFADAAFVFESAWHGRLSFSVKTFEVAEHLVEAMAAFADTRRESRAAVRRTLNILWAFAEPPPEEAFTTLATLAKRENLRFIIVGPDQPPAFVDERVEAIYDRNDLT